MSSIPGISLKEKMSIQIRVNKLIENEFPSSCPIYRIKQKSLNDQIYNSALSSLNSKLNAKKNINFHYRSNPKDNQINYLSSQKNIIEQTTLTKLLKEYFNVRELGILLKNLSLFVPNERIRNLFPKIKKETLNEIYNDYSDRKNKVNLIYNYETEIPFNRTKIKNELYKKIENSSSKEKKLIEQMQIKQENEKKQLDKLLYNMGIKLNNAGNNNYYKKINVISNKKYNRSSSVRYIPKVVTRNRSEYSQMVDRNKQFQSYLTGLEILLKQKNLNL